MATARKESSSLTLPLMLGTFLVILGFMYYLNSASQTHRIEVAEARAAALEEEQGGAAQPGADGAVVTLAQLVATPEQFAGQRVTLEDAEVVSRVGDAAFWVETPADSYYLIRLVPVLVEQGIEVASGELATITGTVHMMGDSVLAAWEGAGVITSGQRAEAEFATSFFEAEQIETRAPSGEGGEG